MQKALQHGCNRKSILILFNSPRIKVSINAAIFFSGRSSSDVTGGTVDTARIAKLVGHEGEQSGQVYKITIGRDDINVKEMGAVINARMGLNTRAAFFGTDANAGIAGDLAMLSQEVTPVLALRSNGSTWWPSKSHDDRRAHDLLPALLGYGAG